MVATVKVLVIPEADKDVVNDFIFNHATLDAGNPKADTFERKLFAAGTSNVFGRICGWRLPSAEFTKLKTAFNSSGASFTQYPLSSYRQKLIDTNLDFGPDP